MRNRSPFSRLKAGRRGRCPESEKSFQNSDLEYSTGDKVSHKKFGTGTVLSIVSETRDYKVTVDFDDYGKKIMYASFAKLEKL